MTMTSTRGPAAEARRRLAARAAAQPAPAPIPKKALSEAAFQESLVELAQHLGWRVAHFRPGMTLAGWRTPITADGAGFPDLVLCRDRTVFVELKSATGQLRPQQVEWANALQAAGSEYHLWRPDDWDAITKTLTRNTTTTQGQ